MAATEIGVRASALGDRQPALGTRPTASGPAAIGPSAPTKRLSHTPDGYEVAARITASFAVPAALTGALAFGLSFFAPGVGGAELALYGLGFLSAGVVGTAASFTFEERSTTKRRAD